MTKAEMLASPDSPWSKAEQSERIIVIRESDPLGKLIAELLAERSGDIDHPDEIPASVSTLREFIDGQN